MGEVYRATELRLGRQVAIKILPERLSQDAEALARFEREARSVATLSHPSICTLHDVGREGDVSYLVMELIDGETLADKLLKDGDTLVYYQRVSSGTDLWALSLSGRHAPKPLLSTPFDEVDARFSPDGRYLAFVSDESGRREAYVMPYPGPGEKRRISSNGAMAVRWSPDGREILLLSADGQLWSVPVQPGAEFRAASPSLLIGRSGKPWVSFDVAPDGRLLAIVPVVVGNEMPATVLLNWSAAVPEAPQ